MKNENLKKNLSIFLTILVVGLQFFNYFLAPILHPNFLKQMFGHTQLIINIPYLGDWNLVMIIGRIIGAYILCIFIIRLGFFCIMRIVVVAHIMLSISTASLDFSKDITYTNMLIITINRFFYAFLTPASFMMPSLYLLSQNFKKPVLLSSIICLAISFAAISAFECLNFIKFTTYWYEPLLYSSILMLICYLFFEININKVPVATLPINKRKLNYNEIFLLISFGGNCGITMSYHFVFNELFVHKTFLGDSYPIKSIYYCYYTLTFLLIPVAKFVYKKNLFVPLKPASLGIIFLSVINVIVPTMSSNMYILEQIVFGALAAILVAPCHALVYKIGSKTHNIFEGIFWFVSAYSLLALTPPFFLRLLGIEAVQWLSILYVLPISTLFIFALTKYQKEKIVEKS